MKTETHCYTQPGIQLFNEDCIETMGRVSTGSINAIIIDPPYGILGNHKIETTIDLDATFKEYQRIMSDNSFIAFFGQMPTIINWINTGLKYFKYQDEITWVKRSPTAIMLPIIRQKETIIILKKGKPKFNITKGTYEDIKIPLYLNGLYDYESIKRVISSRTSGKPNKIRVSKLRNDEIYNCYTLGSTQVSEFVNFTNVWSFMPHNKTGYRKEDTNIKHPTVKPLLLIKRLVELLTNENDLVFDGYSGSGTTAAVCINEKRNFIGSELDKDYFDVSTQRLIDMLKQPNLF